MTENLLEFHMNLSQDAPLTLVRRFPVPGIAAR
jgi:hypothetical protein